MGIIKENSKFYNLHEITDKLTYYNFPLPDPSISGSCSGILTGESGELASLGYPGGYMGGLSCYWMIYPPPAKEILLTFQDLDLEAGDGGADCLYDYLEVRVARGPHQTVVRQSDKI